MLPRVGRRAGNSMRKWLASRKSCYPPRMFFELLKPQVANIVLSTFCLEKSASPCLAGTGFAVQGLNASRPFGTKALSS